jgi:3-hydroxymyristoyl/3-hydroxydecanoyl-(acyl carrier protein) dehydratase
MTKPLMNFEGVRAALKQRFPIITFDCVVVPEPSKSIRTIKNVTGKEIHFLAHLLQHTMMPGTLVVEAIG